MLIRRGKLRKKDAVGNFVGDNPAAYRSTPTTRHHFTDQHQQHATTLQINTKNTPPL
jgi:hypothetical protein